MNNEDPKIDRKLVWYLSVVLLKLLEEKESKKQREKKDIPACFG